MPPKNGDLYTKRLGLPLPYLSRCKRIFVNFPVFHDHKKIFLRIANQINVGDGVAVDQKQIGESIYFASKPTIVVILLA